MPILVDIHMSNPVGNLPLNPVDHSLPILGGYLPAHPCGTFTCPSFWTIYLPIIVGHIPTILMGHLYALTSGPSTFSQHLAIYQPIQVGNLPAHPSGSYTYTYQWSIYLPILVGHLPSHPSEHAISEAKSTQEYSRLCGRAISVQRRT